MKRKLLLLVFLVLLSIAFLSSCDQDIVYAESEDGSYAVVVDCNRKKRKLSISDTYNDLPVTTIGWRAFENCDRLAEIDIPSSITTIFDEAFYNCDKLTKIDIPDSVTIIGDSAFRDCDRLVEIYIPDSVIDIGTYGAGKEFQIVLDDSIVLYPVDVPYYHPDNTVVKSAFAGCNNLKIISVGENNKYYKSIDGNLYTKDGKCLIQYAVGRNDTIFTIPDGVTTVCGGAFEDSDSLNKIDIPNSVTTIGSSVFSGCNKLIEVKIPDSVSFIGTNVFNHCDSLINVSIGNSVTYIDYSTFNSCYSLENINVDDNNKYYKSIDGNLYTKDEKTLVQYAVGKEETSFEIPNSVEFVGRHAFFGCDNLASVVIPNSVKFIGDFAFSNCSSLTSIVITDSVNTIGDYAFDNTAYYNDKNNWEDGVLYIGNHIVDAKNDISGEYVIKEGTITIADHAFYKCTNLASVIIPDSVKFIGDYAFNDCYNLDNVVIPDSVNTIGAHAFHYTAYYNYKNNWEDGVLYIGNHIVDINNDISGEYVIKEGTITIADYAFSDCHDLTGVIIPDSVKIIGAHAFNDCYSLANVVIPDSVNTIGFAAFYDCSNLSDITIPDSVNTIGANAFDNTAYYNDKNNWEDEVLYIGNHLIDAESTISGEYVIKGGTITIANAAFAYCDSLTRVVISNNVVSIGDNAFYDCNALTSIVISDVASIGNEAFTCCYNLRDVYYTSSEDEWNTISIGSNNTYLTSVTVHYNYVPEE